MEGFFVNYMFKGIVPFWATDLVRKAQEKLSRGEFHPADYGVQTPMLTWQNVAKCIAATAIIAGFGILYAYIIIYSGM